MQSLTDSRKQHFKEQTKMSTNYFVWEDNQAFKTDEVTCINHFLFANLKCYINTKMLTYALRMYLLLLAMKSRTRKWCHTRNSELSLCVWNRLQLFPVQKFPNSESRAERHYVFEMDCDLIKSKERLNQMAAGPAADDELWTKRG